MKKNLIRSYLDKFSKVLASRIRPNIGVVVELFNCGSEGAILKVNFVSGGTSKVIDKGDFSSILEALGEYGARFPHQDVKDVVFSGTNILLEKNKVIFIKDASKDEWSDLKAIDDFNKIAHPPKSARI